MGLRSLKVLGNWIASPKEATESQIVSVCSQLWIPSPLIWSYHLEWSVPSKTARLQKSTLLFFSFLSCLAVSTAQKAQGKAGSPRPPATQRASGLLQEFGLGALKCLSCPLLLLWPCSCLYSTSLSYLRHLPRVWKGFTSNSRVGQIWS